MNKYNTFWPLIIEKAWAKVKGGYGKIMYGSSSTVIEAFTGANA